MALLTPNATYKMHGVTVNEKIIPDGTRWKDAAKAKKAGFSAGSLYKKQQKLCGTGKAEYVTAHNTNDLAGVYDDGEQYTRATYNENMGSSRVHFYVDDVCAWQNLKAGTGLCDADPAGSAEVSWHSGDGSAADGGNNVSLSIEIIMNDTAEHDAKAKDNGARIAAWLLWKHGLPISRLVSHTYWVNKMVGNKFDDVDEQCCNLVSGQKWCPYYIFGSTNETVALKNWKAFKALVAECLAELQGESAEEIPAEPEQPMEEGTPAAAGTVKDGDIVKLSSDAVYYSGKAIPAWVKAKEWIVDGDPVGSRAVINKSTDGKNAINSPVNVKYLTVVGSTKGTASETPADTGIELDKPASGPDADKKGTYKVTAKIGLNLRTGPSTDKKIIETMALGAQVKCYGYYTGGWLYVVAPSGSVGFCSAEYLSKV